MEEQQKSSGGFPAGGEPVRSRWTPKPEQILILESIFNSGMVNPPKEETVRIRKLLEKFGPVGDANVFYWFQNRRSRSRRRQRQIQASLAAAGGGQVAVPSCSPSSSSGGGGVGEFYGGAWSDVSIASAEAALVGRHRADDLFALSQHMGGGFGDEDYAAGKYVGSCDPAQMQQCQSGSITVFINGIASEVPSGLLNMRAVFGHDALLFHSSGEPLPVNEHGILLQSLQMGESYYLVARSA